MSEFSSGRTTACLEGTTKPPSNGTTRPPSNGSVSSKFRSWPPPRRHPFATAAGSGSTHRMGNPGGARRAWMEPFAGRAQTAGMSHHAVSVAKQERQRKVPRLRCCTKVTHTCQWMEPIDICVHDSNLYSMGQDIAGTNFSAMGMPPWTRSGAIGEY